MSEKDILKARLSILADEASAGVVSSLHRLVGAAYRLGVTYGIPNALEFFNALEFPGRMSEWIDLLPDNAVDALPVEERCFDCFYMRLCAAACSTGVEQVAMYAEALAYMPEDVVPDPTKYICTETGTIGRLLDLADAYREKEIASK